MRRIPWIVVVLVSIYFATIPNLPRLSVAIFALNAAYCGFWIGWDANE